MGRAVVPTRLIMRHSGAQYVGDLRCETEQQRAACHHSACPARKRWGIKRSPDCAGMRGFSATDLGTPVRHSSIDQSLDGVGLWHHSSAGSVSRRSAWLTAKSIEPRGHDADLDLRWRERQIVSEIASAVCRPWSRNQLTALPSYGILFTPVARTNYRFDQRAPDSVMVTYI
ncbi:hypothetical protein IEO21_09660 [Rhodonia placenta]|uniref:Uncharacterized protein n=1 Tax=Rhodonia placenta TaxID=104341 RepID=A0A8H7NTY2_9APHY|nr:hypothetical protein IEO21_09660 [Postia placenta]